MTGEVFPLRKGVSLLSDGRIEVVSVVVGLVGRRRLEATVVIGIGVVVVVVVVVVVASVVVVVSKSSVVIS